MSEGERIALAEAGARRCEGYLMRPPSGRGTGLVILHDMFGINPVFRELASSFAARGCCALLPNLFWRCEPDGPLPYEGGHEAPWARLERFDFDAAVEDIDASVQALRKSPACTGKVAVIGFCFSGRLAFRAAARTDIDAAFSLYALGISRDLGEAGRIACPVQLHYGLADKSVPQAEIDAVASGVAGWGRIELFLYPGAGHSFFNPVRPTYDPEAAALAAARIASLLARIA